MSVRMLAIKAADKRTECIKNFFKCYKRTLHHWRLKKKSWNRSIKQTSDLEVCPKGETVNASELQLILLASMKNLEEHIAGGINPFFKHIKTRGNLSVS